MLKICSVIAVFFAAIVAAAATVDLDREIILTPPVATTTHEDVEIVRWQQRVDSAKATRADYERLGWAFVAKARRTLDNGYYKLAEKTADVMDARFGASPSSDLLRGHIDHNLHRFHDAEAIARKLVSERGLPDDFALLSDALMEQGKLTEAITALQRMADMKPGAAADTRIAHIRWLKGDLRGATTAMEQAIRETSPDDAVSLAWMLTRLAGYVLQQGNHERAEMLTAAALRHVPDYAPALLMQGRAELAAGRVRVAVPLIERAAHINPLPEYEWWLAEAYAASGDRARQAATERQLEESGAVNDPRTLALFLATRKQRVDEALRLARAELDVRQDVFTHDALAWALYASGNVAGAESEMRFARTEHTCDPRLALHATVIALAAGQVADAQAFARQCRSDGLLPSEQALLRNAVATLASPSAPRTSAVAAVH